MTVVSSSPIHETRAETGKISHTVEPQPKSTLDCSATNPMHSRAKYMLICDSQHEREGPSLPAYFKDTFSRGVMKCSISIGSMFASSH